MHTFNLICYIVAAVLFALATFNTPARVNLVAAGLLAWVLVPLVATARA
jgi:hypothetical protein